MVFSLFSTIKLCKDRAQKHLLEEIKKDTQNYSQTHYDDAIRFRKNMRMLHAEALLNKEYSLSCYAESHKMINHGGLALMSPKYFKFTSLLMTLCHQEMTECLIQKRTSSRFEIARKVLFETMN